jgi:hypothetical protein
MKKYCMDTSAISKPLEDMPEDIYPSLWNNVPDVIRSGCIAVTTEIYSEMWRIRGKLGACISDCEDLMKLEVGDVRWEWKSYVAHMKRMENDHHEFISEYNGGSKKTIGLTDMTIIAMAKAMHLPCISMEHRVLEANAKKQKIPNICDREGVHHMTFNGFLRAEGIRM